MRFTDKESALQGVVDKGKAKDKLEARAKFLAYAVTKRHMYAPIELDRLIKDQDKEVWICVEEWLDREDKLKRENLIIVGAVTAAVQFQDAMRFVDQDYGSIYDSPKASPTGKKPQTHYYLQWSSCQDSVYKELYKKLKELDVKKEFEFFDGDKMTVEDALKSLGLLPIVEEMPIAPIEEPIDIRLETSKPRLFKRIWNKIKAIALIKVW